MYTSQSASGTIFRTTYVFLYASNTLYHGQIASVESLKRVLKGFSKEVSNSIEEQANTLVSISQSTTLQKILKTISEHTKNTYLIGQALKYSSGDTIPLKDVREEGVVT